MKKKFRPLLAPFFSLLLCAFALLSCTGSLHDELSPEEMLYVEAWISFLGPPTKWAGASPVTLHVVARESEYPQVALSNGGIAREMNQTRKLASVSKSKKLISGDVRDRLGRIVLLAEKAGSMDKSCLWPVKIKVKHTDGSIYRKTGCRGYEQWVTEAQRLFALSL